MASQRVGRYIAVQQAKGEDPDPQQIARMIQQETQSRLGGEQPSPLSPEPQVVESRAAAIQEAIAPSAGKAEAFSPDVSTFQADPDIGSLEIGDPTLGEALSGKLGTGAAVKGGIKGLASAAYAALTTPKSIMSPASAFVKGAAASLTAPISLAFTLNSIMGGSISGAAIGHNVEGMFGQQAAQEAASVMSGRANLNSISIQGQNAYANAMVAMEQAPKSVTSHLISAIKGTPPTPITSTVTPHHTTQAISRGFGLTDRGFEPMSIHGVQGLGFSGRDAGGFEPMGITGPEGRGVSGRGDIDFGGFEPMGIGDVGGGGGPTPGTGMGGR